MNIIEATIGIFQPFLMTPQDDPRFWQDIIGKPIGNPWFLVAKPLGSGGYFGVQFQKTIVLTYQLISQLMVILWLCKLYPVTFLELYHT